MAGIGLFSKSRVTVIGKVTRVDGTTSVINGTEELGVVRTLLLRLRLWCQERVRRDPK